MSSTAFPIDTAQMVALFMECIFYGIFLVTFGLCLRALLFSHDSFELKSARSVNWTMLVITLAMSVFATLDVAFGLRHNLDAFVYYTGPGGAQGELADISYWVNVMKTLDYALQTAIGDGILLYRCWIMYNKNWLVVTPFILMWMAAFACGLCTVYIEWTLKSSALLNFTQLVPFIDTTLALTLTVNIVATTLIVWQIWRLRARTSVSSPRPTSQLARTIRIMVDSGVMYTASVIVFFATFIAGNNAQYGVSDCIVQIIGITFNLIIIRVDQGKAYGSTLQGSHERSTEKRTTDSHSMRFVDAINVGTYTSGLSETDVDIESSMADTRVGSIKKQGMSSQLEF